MDFTGVKAAARLMVMRSGRATPAMRIFAARGAEAVPLCSTRRRWHDHPNRENRSVCKKFYHELKKNVPRPQAKESAARNQMNDPKRDEVSDLGDWIRAFRSDEAFEMIAANPLAYVLAVVIALRARWHDSFNRHGLELGESLIGDYRRYGMTQQQYRTAKSQLGKWNFATFRATNKGTIAKLTDTRLFVISKHQSNERFNSRPTSSQRAANEQPTTNEETKERKEGKEGKKYRESITGLLAKDLQPDLTEIMQFAGEVLGPDELRRCHRRWFGRAKDEPDKLRRVLNETNRAAKEGEIKTTPAKYSEDLWKRWN